MCEKRVSNVNKIGVPRQVVNNSPCFTNSNKNTFSKFNVEIVELEANE